MKAKLIKHDFGYNLVDTKDKWIATSKDDYSHAVNLDYWLSLKNCQAIEQDSPLQEYILEVNGEGWDDHLYRGSRKQTEWDVEIVMDDVWDGLDSTRIFPKEETSFPKLDVDGCLILKRI